MACWPGCPRMELCAGTCTCDAGVEQSPRKIRGRDDRARGPVGINLDGQQEKPWLCTLPSHSQLRGRKNPPPTICAAGPGTARRGGGGLAQNTCVTMGSGGGGTCYTCWAHGPAERGKFAFRAGNTEHARIPPSEADPSSGDQCDNWVCMRMCASMRSPFPRSRSLCTPGPPSSMRVVAPRVVRPN